MTRSAPTGPSAARQGKTQTKAAERPRSAFERALDGGGVSSTLSTRDLQSAVDGAERQCQAHVRQRRARATGRSQCSNPVAKGSVYCGRHQYLSSTAGRGAQSTIARYKKIGDQLHVSPVAAMRSLIAEAAGNVEYLRGEVRDLEKLWVAGRRERQEVDKIMVLYSEERDRFERYLTDAMRINLELREARLDKQHAEAMVKMARGMIEALGLVGADREEALAAAARILKAIGAASREEAQWQGPLIASREAAIVDSREIPSDAREVA